MHGRIWPFRLGGHERRALICDETHGVSTDLTAAGGTSTPIRLVGIGGLPLTRSPTPSLPHSLNPTCPPPSSSGSYVHESAFLTFLRFLSGGAYSFGSAQQLYSHEASIRALYGSPCEGVPGSAAYTSPYLSSPTPLLQGEHAHLRVRGACAVTANGRVRSAELPWGGLMSVLKQSCAIWNDHNMLFVSVLCHRYLYDDAFL